MFLEFGVQEAVELLEWAGYSVTPPRMGSSDLRRNPERFNRLKVMVEAGLSLNEISRVLKMDHRTILRHFPHAGWEPGGGGDAAITRQVNQDLRRVDKFGNMSRRRHRE